MCKTNRLCRATEDDTEFRYWSSVPRLPAFFNCVMFQHIQKVKVGQWLARGHRQDLPRILKVNRD